MTSPWGAPALDLPTACTTCGDSGEIGDGRTTEHDTGMWVTAPCSHCTHTTGQADD